MNPSILNSEGLSLSIHNRRSQLLKLLQLQARPAYMDGIFIGLKFVDYALMLNFLNAIPEESRRQRVRYMLDKYVKPFSGGYLYPANYIDEILDHASGVL